jgi:hypothetical protein
MAALFRLKRRAARRITPSGRKAALHPHTLVAAEYLILFTTVPASRASAAQIVALYRFRWQIELATKRLKSVLGLAHLTARHDDLCRAVLSAKLLLAVWRSGGRPLRGRGGFSPPAPTAPCRPAVRG